MISDIHLGNMPDQSLHEAAITGRSSFIATGVRHNASRAVYTCGFGRVGYNRI